jgi:hypothetical protein
LRAEEAAAVKQQAIEKAKLDQLRAQEEARRAEEKKAKEQQLLERVKLAQMEQAAKNLQQAKAQAQAKAEAQAKAQAEAQTSPAQAQADAIEADRQRKLAALVSREEQLLAMIEAKEEQRKKLELDLLMREQEELMAQLDAMKREDAENQAADSDEEETQETDDNNPQDLRFESQVQEEEYHRLVEAKAEQELEQNLLQEKMHILKLLEERKQLEAKVLEAEQDKVDQELALETEVRATKSKEQNDIMNLILKARSQAGVGKAPCDPTTPDDAGPEHLDPALQQSLEATIAAFETRKAELEAIMLTQLSKINYAESLERTELELTSKITANELKISQIEDSNIKTKNQNISATEPSHPNPLQDQDYNDQEEIDRLTVKLTEQEMLQAEEERMTAELEWL